MSAYGALSRPARSTNFHLPATTWRHPRDPHAAAVTVFHLDPSAIGLASGADAGVGEHAGLFDYLHAVFADEVDKGLTYPQEDMRDPETFKAYFFAADVVIALLCDSEGAGVTHNTGSADGDGLEVDVNIERVRAGRPWDACVVGFYYIKPNYPGRSSHICNAGFVVPPSQRNGGYGRVLARSFLYYAPRLGYRASVFNLVYVNNVASVRIWESLGFVKAGLIPEAGRLKRTDGPGEKYVDALVFYKRFDDVQHGGVPAS